MIGNIVLCLILGYAFGCFSTGYVCGKKQQVDVRKHGSGNIGTTNTLRTLGFKAGVVTLIGDILKAIIPICLLCILYKKTNQPLSRDLVVLYTGLGVVCGHNFPFWLKFKGGKGIAAMAGVIIAFNPWLTIIEMILFLGIVAITRYVSLGSLVVATVLPLSVLIGYKNDPNYLHMVIVCFIFMLLAFYKHRENIKRLLTGTENKFGKKAA